MRLNDGLAVVRSVLAAEYGCRPEDFDQPGVHVRERPDERHAWPEQGRRYAVHHPAISVASFGLGTLVAASAELLPQVRDIFAGLDRDDALAVPALSRAAALLHPFDRQLAGPYPRLLCGTDTLRRRPSPDGITVTLELSPPARRLLDLGGPDIWPNAISRRAASAGKEQAAVAVATRGSDVAGVASLGRDAPRLWQIGIDVIERYQGRGIAGALVMPLAEYALGQGVVPWYSLAPANIRSLRTALATGFVPGWVEVFSYGPLSTNEPGIH